MLICQTHLKGNRLPYLFKNLEKPNFTCSASRKFYIKALGFTRSLVNAVSLEEVVFFYDFHGFGGIRSTQPTNYPIIWYRCPDGYLPPYRGRQITLVGVTALQSSHNENLRSRTNRIGRFRCGWRRARILQEQTRHRRDTRGETFVV